MASLKHSENSNSFFINSKDLAIDVLDSIQMSINKNPIKNRPKRATGFSLQVLAEIVQLLKPETTQAFLMTGGPCTVGPGKMASLEISQYLRRDEDIRESPDIKQMEEEAQRFYQQIQMSLLMLNCSLNLISYSLD